MKEKKKNNQLPILIALVGILFIVGGVQLHRFSVADNAMYDDGNIENDFDQIDLIAMNCSRQMEMDGIRDDEFSFLFEEGLLSHFSENNIFNTDNEEARLLFQLEMEERNTRFEGITGYSSMIHTEGNITINTTNIELSILDKDQVENIDQFIFVSYGQTMDEVRQIFLSNGFACE